MIQPDEALHLVLQVASRREPRTVPLEEACGLELADPVVATGHQPPFARAMMDGFAVRLADAGRTVPIAGSLAAGQAPADSLPEAGCMEIMTGAACPPGTEAVVPKEDARRVRDEVTLPEHIEPGQHIAPVGSECREGDVLLQAGDVITPLAIAAMASFGIRAVRTIPKPSLGIVTTGAELVPFDSQPGPGQIRNSNGPMLAALCRWQGLESPGYLHAADQVEAIVEALRELMAKDIVLLTGGVSVGGYDLVPPAVRHYGAEMIFHKVAQKPGKPLLFARRGAQLVFGLPGNPLAAHFCFHRYVAAAVRQMCGAQPATAPQTGRLAAPVDAKPERAWFVPAVAVADSSDGSWLVRALPGASSADVFSSCRANCYVEIPPGSGSVPEGATVQFTWIVPLPSTNR